MKFSTSFNILVTSLGVTAVPHLRRQAGVDKVAIDALLPSFGVVPGTDRNAIQTGSCRGIKLTGDPVLIQCSVTTSSGTFTCPPDRAEFVAKLSTAVAAGKVTAIDENGNQVDTSITFSTDATDNSPETLKARATAGLTMLQSFSGLAGTGCPAVAAPNFQRMQLDGQFHDGVLVP